MLTTVETMAQTEPTTLVADTTRIPAEVTTACPDCATTTADETRLPPELGISCIAAVCIVVEILHLQRIVQKNYVFAGFNF